MNESKDNVDTKVIYSKPHLMRNDIPFHVLLVLYCIIYELGFRIDSIGLSVKTRTTRKADQQHRCFKLKPFRMLARIVKRKFVLLLR